MKGETGTNISNVEITIRVKGADGTLDHSVLNEYESPTPLDLKVHDFLAKIDKPVHHLQACYVECPDNIDQDIEISFERTKSLEDETMTAMHVSVYMDGTPYRGFVLQADWHGENSITGSKDLLNGKNVFYPLRFGKLNSTEHYEDAMSRESALQLGEILITIELGKVVTVDQKTTSYKSHKPLKWKPPRIALVDEPVAEKKKILIDRTIQHGQARPLPKPMPSPTPIHKPSPTPIHKPSSTTVHKPSSTPTHRPLQVVRPAKVYVAPVVLTPPPIKYVKVFEAFRRHQFDYAFSFKYRSRQNLIAREIIPIPKEKIDKDNAEALEETLQLNRKLKLQLDRLLRQAAAPRARAPVEDAFSVPSTGE